MNTSNPTVLVADDDTTIRRNLVRLLRSEGYQTIEAADGDAALAGVHEGHPDAVLLDLKMPRRDGLTVLADLQPLLADLPVIVITALGGSAAAIEAMRRGAYDYLSKPFDLDEVLLTLKRASGNVPWPWKSRPCMPRRRTMQAMPRKRSAMSPS